MRIASIILFFLISINSFCQWKQTEGPITNISISDILSCDSALVASAPCGTFISINNGDSWSPVSPENFNTHIFFKNELYLGGESIRKISKINQDWVESYSLYKRGKTFDLYSDDQRIYAALESSGFNYSGDGKNWTSYNENLPREEHTSTSNTTYYYTYDLFAIDGNEKYIFVGTKEGIYRTLKSNLSWSAINSNLDNTKVNAILCKDSVVFIAKGNKIYQSDNNGTSWKLSHTFSTDNRIIKLIVINDSIFALTKLEGIYISSKFGNDWVANNNGLKNLSTFSITNHKNEFFLANEEGVFKNLTNWQAISRHIICSHIIDLEKNDSCFAAVDFNNVSITKDKGLSWENSTGSISMGTVWNVVNLNNTLLFTANGPGIAPQKNLNYISENNGDIWLNKTDLIYDHTMFMLKASGNNVIAAGNVYVFLSKDKGTTWDNISPPAGFVCNRFEDALFVGNDIYVAGCGNREIIKTSDFGLTWNFVNEGLPNEKVYKLGECQGVLFAATDSYLFRLENNKKSWEYSGKGFPKYRPGLSTLVNDFASSEQYFFLCTPDSVYASKNQGKTWSNINPGLPKLPNGFWSGALLIDNNILYYGTNNYGVWKLNISELQLPEDTLEKVENLFIYPNPTRDMIYFRLPENDVGEKIEFFDISGRMIYSSEIIANKLNIENIPAGLYIISIKSLRNGLYHSKVLKIK
jgi:photosystem II stability/assembly factor-like uncharacterized protein